MIPAGIHSLVGRLPARRRWRWATLALVWLGAVLPGTSSGGQAQDSDIPIAELTAYLQARPAFERNCFRCHNANGDEASRKTLDQLDMTRYPFEGRRGQAAGRLIRKALIGTAGQRTMPKDDPDGLSTDDLTLILKWTDAFDVARVKKHQVQAPWIDHPHR